MRTITFIFALLFSAVASAQNPTIDIVHPKDGAVYQGVIIAHVSNFTYQPEQATNARLEFNNGQKAFGEGHAHGWIFELDPHGQKIRNDLNGPPTPGDYYRFFGAGNATWLPTGPTSGFYIVEPELERGEYKFFVQLQHDDHTASLQQTAPAMPAFDSLYFRVKKK